MQGIIDKLTAAFFTPKYFRRKLFGGVLLVNALIFALAAFSIHEDKLEHERRARTSVRNISLLLSHDIISVFDRIEIVLHTIVDDVEDQLSHGGIKPARLNALLKLQQTHLPEIISLRATDQNGVVRYGEGLPSGTLVSLSDRDHFLRQKNNSEAGLVIAKPVEARISKQWSIPVSRRYNFPDGRFAGIVYVNIPVSYFVRIFSELNMGYNGLVSLRSAEHLTMARFPETQQGGGAIGQYALSAQLRELLKDNPDHATYLAPSPTDKIERYFSYQSLGKYPLYVVSGISTDEVMKEWWWDSQQTIAFLVIVFITSIIFASLLSRSWHRQVATSEILSENEQRWSFALESGNFAVWDWDIPSGKMTLSKLGKRLFGYDDKDIDDHMNEWTALCHPEDQAYVIAAFKDHFRGRAENFSAEFRMRCKNGNWKWIQSRGLVVKRAEDGRPLRMIGLHADISERKKAEEALILTKTVFDLADEAMVVTDVKNNIISVNPAFTVITGYTPDEVIGKNPRMLSAKSHSPEFYQNMWNSLYETGSWSGEVLNRRKNGEVFVEWLTIKRVLDDKGFLTNHVAVFSDITDRKATEEHIRHLALHDALTDLPNRTLLAERLEQAILRAKRDGYGFALVYFDLDKFKPVNDKHGHEVGDWLLKSVAIRVLECIRESDTVARLGGDEFVVLLAKISDERDAMQVAEKIRDTLSRPFMFGDKQLEIGASIGLALYPEHGDNQQSLTEHADMAMYAAKKSGRNRVVLFNHNMNQGSGRNGA